MKKQYQVWVEDSNGEEVILFTGSKVAAYKYYNWKRNDFKNLHIGYIIPELA
jgi:hypothetical protein